MASLELQGVGLTYPDGFTALSEVDLRVADGEFVALVGPSGSGKTTLLRTVAGFLAPSTGTVRIGGEPVADGRHTVAPEKRRLGMVFQQHAVWPHMSVARNVGYPLRIAKAPGDRIAARVEEVLNLVGLAGYGDRMPATLSGGQRQRVALARALAPEPTVLLLDEALSALDEPLRDQLRVELRALTQRMGLTVVHVTHDRDEALALADRIVVLDGGRVVQHGAPRALLESPAAPFVASFLSDATLVRGRWEGGRFIADGHPLVLDADRVEVASRDGVRAACEGEGTLAILPHDVEVEPAPKGGADASGAAGTSRTADAAGGSSGTASVVSSLFGRRSCSVVVDWAGLRLRAESPWQPRIDDAVGVRVRRALFYRD